jgi:Glycosyl hydrolase family 79 C-terminal beta domain
MKRLFAHTSLLFIATAALGLSVTKGGASAGATQVTVQVTVGHGGRVVPVSFLGVSVEPKELLSFERRPAFGRLLDQLAAPGGGRLVLRIGGRAADTTYWQTPGLRPPPGAYTLPRRWLPNLASLVRAARLRVILNVNLVANAPRMAGLFAAAATHVLPAGAIVAVEIGNEPDLYGWGRNPPIPDYSPTRYAHQYSEYARALTARHIPGTLAGPSLNGISPPWIAAALAAGRGTLGIITVHRYPFWAGYPPGTPGYPNIRGLLSDSSTTGLAATLQQEVAMTHAAGRRFRITEMGTSAGSVSGVTNTFATALWAPDALLSMISAGVDGVNVHIRSRYSNSALNASGPPRPLFYGVALAARTLGADATLLPATVTQPDGASLKAWAVRIRGNVLHLLLINRGNRALTVSVPLPGRGAATLQRLLAPSVTATTGETLAGQSLNAAGTWRGRRSEPRVSPRAGRYTVTMPGRSAALLTVALRGR